MCGKTIFTWRLIHERHDMIRPEVEQIHYYYAEYQPIFDYMSIHEGVQFFEGMPTLGRYQYCSKRTLLIIDDMQDYLEANKHEMIRLFTRMSHHGCQGRGISIIFITHEVFDKGVMKKLRSNCDNLVLFRCAGEKKSIADMSQRWFPECPRRILSAFTEVTRQARWTYLLLDSTADSDACVQIRTNIFPEDKMEFF
jgi:hypothetical protein